MGRMISHARGTIVKGRIPVSSRCLARPVTDVLPSGCWKNETCFIVGGGPSLENFNWECLNGHRVITINKAFLYYPAPVNFAMDYTFFDMVNILPEIGRPNYELAKRWRDYYGIKVFVRHDRKHRFAEGLYYVDANLQRGLSFDLEKEGIFPTNNSGGGAITFAAALGCKNIGLLGYDLKVTKTKTHFHDGYQFQGRNNLVRNLDNFRKNIEALAPLLDQHGIRTVNLSSDSALQQYERMDFSTFCEEVYND